MARIKIEQRSGRVFYRHPANRDEMREALISIRRGYNLDHTTVTIEDGGQSLDVTDTLKTEKLEIMGVDVSSHSRRR